MRLKSKILLFVYALLQVLIAAGIVLLINFVIGNDMVPLDFLRDHKAVAIAAMVFFALMFLFSVYAMIVIFRKPDKKEPKDEGVTLPNDAQSNGTVRVSLPALEMLVQQAVSKNLKGIADIKTRVLCNQDSVSVKIDASVEANTHIPEISMLLQNNIKSFVEEYSGIAVHDVSIVVSSVITVAPQYAIEGGKTGTIILPDGAETDEPVLKSEEAENSDDMNSGAEEEQ